MKRSLNPNYHLTSTTFTWILMRKPLFFLTFFSFSVKSFVYFPPDHIENIHMKKVSLNTCFSVGHAAAAFFHTYKRFKTSQTGAS